MSSVLVKTGRGIVEILPCIPSMYAHRLTAGIHIYDRSAVEEGAYIPSAHIYWNLNADQIAELAAAFSKLNRQLRGVEE